MIRQSMFAAAAVLGMSAAALAQDKPAAEKPKEEIKPITIGDAARPIDISNWIKGDKIAKFEPGKIYVLEFWATWCGPCRQSMPHLAAMQKEYKDYGVTFIGISDEPLETVTKFLDSKNKDLDKPWNEVITYTLTTDPDKSVYNDYFKAASQSGIPSAFVIGKDLHVEWIGNPHPEADDHFEDALKAIAHGEWDRNAFKTKWEKETAAERARVAFQQDYVKAMRAKDYDKALELLDAQIAKNDEAFNPKFQKFTLLLNQMNEPKKAYPLGETLAKQNWDNAQILNQMAWFVVDTEGVQSRDLDFALRLATHANELKAEKDGMILDTLARVYYEKGDVKKAVEVETKAVANLPEGAPAQIADSIRATLKKYEDEAAKGKK